MPSKYGAPQDAMLTVAVCFLQLYQIVGFVKMIPRRIKIFLFLPPELRREVMRMQYITWGDFLMFCSLVIAIAKFVYDICNKKK